MSTPATPADRFAASLAFTWRLDNDGQPYHVTPGDRGGPTAWGVTFAAYAAWRRAHGKLATTDFDLLHAAKDDLAVLIRTNYWNAVQADHLPPGVDLLVYDFGFGSGPGTSARVLQRALGVGQDGVVGPATLAAAHAAGRSTLVPQLAAMHQSFYASLADYVLFGRGWSRRNSARLALALEA